MSDNPHHGPPGLPPHGGRASDPRPARQRPGGYPQSPRRPAARPYGSEPQGSPNPGPYQRPPQSPGAYRRPDPGEQPTRPYDQPAQRHEQPPPSDVGEQYSTDPYHHAWPPSRYQEPAQPREYLPYSDEYQRRPYPQPAESPVAYQRERDRRADRATTIANIIHVVAGLIAICFVLHIVFVLFGANQNSGVVSFSSLIAKVFLLGFGNVFTPSNATLGVVLNDGLAAIIYVVVGQLLTRTLRRR